MKKMTLTRSVLVGLALAIGVAFSGAPPGPENDSVSTHDMLIDDAPTLERAVYEIEDNDDDGESFIDTFEIETDSADTPKDAPIRLSADSSNAFLAAIVNRSLIDISSRRLRDVEKTNRVTTTSRPKPRAFPLLC